MNLPPSTPLREIEWIPRQRLHPLARLGLHTLEDLLRHYPRRHEDRRAFAPFPDCETPSPILLHGRVAATAHKRFGRSRGVFEATLQEPSPGPFSHLVILRWFNMPYMQGIILAGQELVVFGRAKTKGRQIVMDHPEYEILEAEDPGFSHMRKIVPIHPAGEGITPRAIRPLVWRALETCDLRALSLLPEGPDNNHAEALREIHFPASFESLARARQTLALEECLLLQTTVALRRNTWHDASGHPISSPGRLRRELLRHLPFQLTPSQQEVLARILADLAAPRRMHRLLQGDVGAGKTIVALLAMLECVEAGRPALLMAPTQILAGQHFSNFQRLAAPLGVPVELRTGARRTSPAPLLEKYPPIIVGTHALLHETDSLAGAGLVVIDEQHKFGVLQRAKLAALPSGPDVLVMTATPIPRTLAQTLYGDLEVSTIREKPAGRCEVRTAARPLAKLPEAAAFLRERLQAGHQAYIVYPLIEESEKLEAKAAAAEFDKWRKLLDPLPVGLLHGRTPPDEKDAVMTAFREHRIAALVSTSVIEVGVDVPNATLLLVENAERFGLAQLHQLRGRIGRGSQKSWCILLHADDLSPEAATRLAVLERTNDGFEIAEEDLRIRGPGDILGTAQSGLPPLRLASLPGDSAIMEAAAALASEILARDPALAHHPRLRERAQTTLDTPGALPA